MNFNSVPAHSFPLTPKYILPKNVTEKNKRALEENGGDDGTLTNIMTHNYDTLKFYLYLCQRI